ncbi:LPXTG-site transpeptidase (sortase) family protein [Bittarella massiliensis (ex Durand et al. 2017)]|uniref:LPXTG-site transpeptidase (Sortase) family protein n=1 Tax=Bittarella massiliensis (ex Durand et al. 2017) TaxID=1720313 RepID=A0AAQ1MDB1_9FIRM|nr:LPXTG-site transpeptidase (sortase) family protein [Bittarella massiliensis (ex Durand et al. 2017)]
MLEVLQQQIPTQEERKAQEDAALEQTELPDYVLNPDMEMPTQEIEGNDYIGVVDIPSLGLSLPVMSEWSYPKLKLAPCRYYGSAYTGCLTIVAHNYHTHFGLLREVLVGTQVLFTDVKGRQFSYEVSTVETIEATAIEDAVSSVWDLTLITCTTGGQTRLAVRCLKTD